MVQLVEHKFFKHILRLDYIGYFFRSGGIEVQGLLASPISRKKILSTPVLECYEFVPNEMELPLPLSVRLNTQIVCENLSLTRIVASLEIVDESTTTDPETLLLTPWLKEALGDLPLVQSDAKVFSANAFEAKDINVVTNGNLKAEPKIYTVVIGTKLLEKKEVSAYCKMFIAILRSKRRIQIQVKFYDKLNSSASQRQIRNGNGCCNGKVG